MPARVTILCGPARCGKTQRLLTRYRDALVGRPPGAALWLAPTWRAAAEIRQKLLDGSMPGCFQPGVMTFGNFAETVLRAARLPIRPMSRLMKRELIRQLLFEQSSRGRLRHFLPIAKTSGLVDLVCEFISELKRLEIWPPDFHRACEARGLTDKDVELFELYEAYQQSLREHGLFDAEGRFWSARDLLREAGENDGITKPQAALPAPLFLVADGFTDFTRTQHEILDLLAKQAEEMFITLPLEGEPCRGDLFAKPTKTLAELRRRHPGAAVELMPRPGEPAWPAIARLEQTLFENPRAVVRSDGAAVPEVAKHSVNIEILAAARPLGEIELVGARIKRLLAADGVKPGDVAVVFRSLGESGELIDEVFGRLGIPFVVESGQTLDRSPALRALAMLLKLDLEDWPFDRLLALLGGNYFQPDWPAWHNAPSGTVEQTIRGLQIPHGRKRLIEQLATAESDALDAIKRLAAAFDALPQRATLPDWAKAWRRLAGETGLLRAMNDDVPSRLAGELVRRDGDGDADSLPTRRTSSPAKRSESDVSSADRRAWGRLMESLGEGDRLAAWLDRHPPEIDRREAFETLLDILRSDRLGHAGDESGCVRVLSAESVRSLRVPYLFLAGLSEKAFPPPDREDRLYNEADYARLIDAGLPLVGRAERTREEMLLFYEAVTRAAERLYLSYPALDDAAQPLLPSPFLSEIEEAFGPGEIPRFEQTDLSPIPTDDEPLCEADFRVKAVATALEGNVSLLAALLREGTGISGKPQAEDSIFPLLAGLDLIHLRQDRDRFGPAEGVLPSDAARDRLESLFPPSHTFSATNLERYASCPFRYFMERVLKIEPIEDLALEFDVLERGSVAHEVLAKFHARVNARLGGPASPLRLDPAEFDSIMVASIADSLPPETGNPVQAALREVNRRLVVEWLEQYRDQCEKYDEQWKDLEKPMAPMFFEASFGRDEVEPPSTAKPLDFVSEGQTFHIAGKIDRVDVGMAAGETVFNVLDYKTGGAGKISPDSVKAGLTLQLPIYALAVMELFLPERDAWPWRAAYWYVRDGGFKPRQALTMYWNDQGRIELDREWEDIRDGLAEVVAGLVHAIRSGRFPICSADDRCTGYCPYRSVCRINHVRSLEKTCQPTSMSSQSDRV